ncbi:Cactin [Hypsibius exemplaris]|uniref:Splicing factor Cactin n=1 Tax=Hypsibius exemplaris TaxID=2072580 RepID=A0A1W0W9W7_HYPEX|nr:Cactin [Hypsibius exemplaris]
MPRDSDVKSYGSSRGYSTSHASSYREDRHRSEKRARSPSPTRDRFTSNRYDDEERNSRQKVTSPRRRRKRSSSSGASSSPRRRRSSSSEDDESRRKRSKAMAKERETPAEKLARRMAKRAAKREKLQQRASSMETAEDPFGDPEIHQPFVWKSKLKKEGLEHLSLDEIKARSRQKAEAAKEELDEVRQRRKIYEKERADREEEQQLVQREKEAAQFRLWEEQEDVFHLRQAQLRSEIRIRDGRAKPIDLLAQYIGSQTDDLVVDVHEPYTYVEGRDKSDLLDLLQDIATYQKLEGEQNSQYWKDIAVIANEELSKIARSEAELERRAGREGINASVSTDVTSIFKGKTLAQLIELEKQIKGKIFGRTEGVDVSYWESLSQQVGAYIARVRLREKHQENLQRKLVELKKEQGIKDEDRLLMPPPQLMPVPASTSTQEPSTSAAFPSQPVPADAFQSDEEQQRIAEYHAGQYSPTLIPFGDIDVVVELVEPEDDMRKLQMSRSQVMKTGSAALLTNEDTVFEREAKKGMGDDEAQFSVETPLDQPLYVWSDKYRPRKPRYFNRVHTGFEWNKYNQTHYDLDNPPPKVVQGYKFNIFYPDLISKQSEPRYTITPCKDNGDFSILRVSAGPPYEDIAFKIVNREWEYSQKRGYRCWFNNNIFQLWFHFKRYRYRR